MCQPTFRAQRLLQFPVLSFLLAHECLCLSITLDASKECEDSKFLDLLGGISFWVVVESVVLTYHLGCVHQYSLQKPFYLLLLLVATWMIHVVSLN